jgi:hypothetical protein
MLHDQYRGAAPCAGDEAPTSFQRQAYAYARHGVTTLFAALEVATGQVTDDRCLHRRMERSPAPIAWTKDADEILGQIHRAKTKTNALTDH